MFNAGFSEYVVPLQMTEAALAEHLDVNGIDAGCSRVLGDPEFRLSIRMTCPLDTRVCS